MTPPPPERQLEDKPTLLARISALEQLLAVYEQVSTEQHAKLEATLAELAATSQRLITVERERAELADRRNAELNLKNEEVEAFVYVVSHDLRAPLINLQGFSKELEVAIRALAGLIEEHELPASIRARVAAQCDDIFDSLHHIRTSTTKFQRLIDALLSLSRHGRIDYRFERIDVRELVTATLDTLRGSLKGIDLVVGDLPEVVADATALGQVFANLITNAAHALTGSERQGCIELGGAIDPVPHYWVRDNGSGIPDSARPRLFQAFQRFHPERAHGEGMGLAIVKRIVERHGGTVWVESRLGEGSTFHFTIAGRDA